MPKIPKDVAERIYALYEITLQEPMPFEAMFTLLGADMFEFSEQHKMAYERGIVKPATQISWIHNLCKKVSDPNEPYDMGVLNALELISHITAGTDPVFVKKPTSVNELKEEVLAGNEELGAVKKALAAAKRTLAQRMRELTKAVKADAKPKETSKSSKKGS